MTASHYWLPQPADCRYSHFSNPAGQAHYCHVQWTEPEDPTPWNAAVEWYGPLDDLNIDALEAQGFLKLVEFIRSERIRTNVERT